MTVRDDSYSINAWSLHKELNVHLRKVQSLQIVILVEFVLFARKLRVTVVCGVIVLMFDEAIFMVLPAAITD